jgi:hypothetical protein
MLGLTTTRKANRSAFDSFMATVRAVAGAKRCELCGFWGGVPDAKAPKGWKRCNKSKRSTSALYTCADFEPATHQ